MSDALIVFFCVAMAAGYIAYKARKAFRGGRCSGCSSCDCNDTQKRPSTMGDDSQTRILQKNSSCCCQQKQENLPPHTDTCTSNNATNH